MAARSQARASDSVEVDGARILFRDPADAAAHAIARAALKATRNPERAIKRGRRKLLFALEHEGRSFLIKVNYYPGGVRDWYRRSKARREWERTQAVAARGIETPQFFLIAEEHTSAGRLSRCLALVERVDGARDLGECWRRGAPSWPERTRWAEALGILAGRMHGAGVLQRDFAPNNVLVAPGQPTPRFLPIDFERAALVARIAPRDEAITLAKLLRYFFDAPSSLWWRFLLAYCDRETDAARALARRVATELPPMFRRDLAHRRRNAGRASRRFRPVSGDVVGSGGRQGWAHRAISDDRLGAALRGEGTPHFWLSPVPLENRGDALKHWAIAQTLSQRAGLIAKPLALVGPHPQTGGGWTMVSARRAGEESWPESPGAAGALRVLQRRIRSLGLRAPRADQVLRCAEAPGARLRLPPN